MTDNGKHTALKPCPFCGGEAKLRETVEHYPADAEGPAGSYSAWFNVECDDCGIKVGEEYRDEAIAAWNRRAVNSHEALVAALKNARVMLVAFGGDPRSIVAENGSIQGDEIQAALLDEIDAALTTADAPPFKEGV